MPQATDELRDRMNARFGDPINDEGPHLFLLEAGYALNRDWTWSKPGVTDVEQMTEEEYECLAFLVDEWDYGGLDPDTRGGRADG